MDDVVYFVREVPVATLEDGNVYVEVTSGTRVFRFEGSISVFMATFAHFGAVASEWQAKRQYAMLEGGNISDFRR